MLRKLARSLASGLLNVLSPQRCLACEALDPEGSGYCATCGEPQPLLDITCHLAGVPVFAGARYAEPLISAIHRFKYGAAPELCAALCRQAARGIDLLGIEPSDVWVPVPLHPLRLAERGYNQAALLARELAQHSAGSSRRAPTVSAAAYGAAGQARPRCAPAERLTRIPSARCCNSATTNRARR